MQYSRLKLIICVVLVCWGQNAFCQTPSVEVISYDIKASLNILSSDLQVSATLELLKADTSVEFDLILNSNVKIGAVRYEMEDRSVDLRYVFVGKDTLRLSVPPELAASRNLTVDFKYTYPLDGKKGNVMILDRGDHWYPLMLDQIARFKITATVPKGYDVFSAGDFIEKKDFRESSRFVWESEIPVFKISLIIARSNFYSETKRECGGKSIYFYSSTLDQQTKEKVLSEACSIVQFYEEFIGPYHHNRLTLIEIPELEGTSISTALLMIGSTFIDAFKQGQYENLHLSIAAQWMAAGVFFKFRGKGFWFLQLSLPHYLRLMYLERTKGEDAFSQGMQGGLNAYKEVVGTEKDVAILDVDFPDTKEKSRVIYGKGPLVIDQVRRQIGDQNWERFIQDIYKDFKGKILTYDDFLNYLSKYDRKGAALLKLKKMVSEKGLPED